MVRSRSRLSFAPLGLRSLERDLVRESRVIRRIVVCVRDHVIPYVEGGGHMARKCGILDIRVGVTP